MMLLALSVIAAANRLVDDPSSVLEALARVLSLDGTAITWASVRKSN